MKRSRDEVRDYFNLECVTKLVSEKTNGKLRICPSFTQEMLEAEILKTKKNYRTIKASQSKILVKNADNDTFEVMINHIMSGHTKCLTKEEKERNRTDQMKARPKGIATSNFGEHHGIHLLSQLIGRKLMILNECRLMDFCFFEEEKEEMAFAQFTVVKFTEKKGHANTHKSVVDIIEKLTLGGCFIFLVLLNEEIFGSYILFPTDLPLFKEKAKQLKSLSQTFRAIPFSKRSPNDNTFLGIMMPYFIPACKIKNKLDEYIRNLLTPRRTVKFLNGDMTMVSSSHYKEHLYITNMNNLCGKDMTLLMLNEGKGDAMIYESICEAKMASSNSYSGYVINLRSSRKKTMDFNKVDSIMIAMPLLKRPRDIHSQEYEKYEEMKMQSSFYNKYIYLPTRSRDQKSTFAPVGGLEGWRSHFHFKFQNDTFSTSKSQYTRDDEALIIDLDNDENENREKIKAKMIEWKARPPLSDQEWKRIQVPKERLDKEQKKSTKANFQRAKSKRSKAEETLQ